MIPSPTASILITGSEVLDGRIVDTNSNFLIEQMRSAGIGVHRVAKCGDTIPDIVRSLSYLFDRSTVVLVSGGLGPTTDDLTREAISEFTDRKLILHGDVLGLLEEHFRKRQRPFDPSNCKQALFPDTAVTIHNPVGSARGFYLRLDVAGEPSRWLFALPGVPAELRPMIKEGVLPLLKQEFRLSTAKHSHILRVFGLGESVVGSRVTSAELPENVAVAYRVAFPEVEVVLKGDSAHEVESAAKLAKAALGDHVYAEASEGGIEQVINQLLTKRRLSISGAESCTGGLVGALLTNLPGASKFFPGSIVAYANEVKHEELGVQKKYLKEHGAVSAQVAQAMAENVRDKFDTDIAFSVTGIAGPDGGSAKKPVGLFYVGYADKKGSAAYRFFLSSTRTNIRRYASWMALDVVRRHLLKLPVIEHTAPSVSSSLSSGASASLGR